MKLKRDFDCSTIAFYGFGQVAPRKRASLYKDSIEWLKSMSRSPDRLGLSGRGFSSRVLAFGRQDDALNAKGFEALTQFELYSVAPDYRDQTKGILLAVHVSFQERYSIIFGRRDLTSLLDTSVTFAHQVALLTRPAYGIGYTRPFSLGPDSYALGVGQGLGLEGDDYEEGLRINRWMDALDEKAYKRQLRDVYPQNYLTDAHLQLPVGESKLRNWIEKDRAHGELRSFIDGLHLWTVRESQVAIVRASLISANLLYSYL